MCIAIGVLELFILNVVYWHGLAISPSRSILMVRSAIYGCDHHARPKVSSSANPRRGAARTPHRRVSGLTSSIAAVIAVVINLGFFYSQHHWAARAAEISLPRRYHSPVEENLALYCLSILPDRPGLPSGSAASESIVFSIVSSGLLTQVGCRLSRRSARLRRRRNHRDMATRYQAAVECRPLQLFRGDGAAALVEAASQFELEFGRGAKNTRQPAFRPVIVGEIGDVKRAIVFNGDRHEYRGPARGSSAATSTAGFLASRAAMARFRSVPPFAVRDLGRFTDQGTRRRHRCVVGIDPLAADPA